MILWGTLLKTVDLRYKYRQHKQLRDDSNKKLKVQKTENTVKFLKCKIYISGFRIFSDNHRAFLAISQSGISTHLAKFLNTLLRRKESKGQ